MPAAIVAMPSCDLLKNSYLCLLNNTRLFWHVGARRLWFAEKFVSLLIEQHRYAPRVATSPRCDLLKNSYLCLLNNTLSDHPCMCHHVVICWKIRIFAYWTTPHLLLHVGYLLLWFAEKFVSLLIEQHRSKRFIAAVDCCDLLKNSYLCLLNNTYDDMDSDNRRVVICWKIRIFAYWTTPVSSEGLTRYKLWFAEKFVSLLIEQHL